MARHPWVAAADDGIRFGVQIVVRPHEFGALVEAGQLVEALGFDGLFVFDHPAVHPDPWVCLARLSGETARVRLGSVVNCAPYRHPAHLARLAADLDNLSDGRLVLGLGTGWLEAEFRAFDVPFRSASERLAALEETIAVVEGVWGPTPFSFAGTHVRTEAMRVEPPPRQQPRPPIMIGGGGERGTLRAVARFADACNIGEPPAKDDAGPIAGDGAATIRHKLDVLRRHCAEVGRPEDEILRTHFTQSLVLAPTEEARLAKLVRDPPEQSGSPGLRRSGGRTILTGTVDQVATYFRERVALGVQYFVVQLDATDHETIELLARQVVPRVLA
jgi:alkanesulfonate monooxygenase SsuD/methylene tetrahydromethanopterin reductase-like flavin-dependent oxidoreductase (luciferase family)